MDHGCHTLLSRHRITAEMAGRGGEKLFEVHNLFQRCYLLTAKCSAAREHLAYNQKPIFSIIFGHSYNEFDGK